jgi:3-oxoadipate enol-lactonase
MYVAAMGETHSVPTIHYDRRGEHGPRVLLIMGLGMGGGMWDPQVEDLACDHQVLTFDHRGIGASERSAQRFSIRDLAEDARRVADELSWDAFHVVGVSMGGMVAQELTLAYPQRVRSLTLIATHSGGNLGVVPTLRGGWSMLRAAAGSLGARTQALSDALYPSSYQRGAHAGALRERIQRQILQPRSARTPLLQLLAVARFDVRDRVHSITCPTLVVQPAQDLLVRPAHSERLATRIPGATLRTYPDAGHGVTFQEAERVSNDIRAHIERAERLPSAA